MLLKNDETCPDFINQAMSYQVLKVTNILQNWRLSLMFTIFLPVNNKSIITGNKSFPIITTGNKSYW